MVRTFHRYPTEPDITQKVLRVYPRWFYSTLGRRQLRLMNGKSPARQS